MTRRYIGVEHDFQVLPNEKEYEIIRRIQAKCADLAEGPDKWQSPRSAIEGGGWYQWSPEDGAEIATWLNESTDPWSLFTFIDEKTGHFSVGYRTKDGREWFHILRQMRNLPGSGLFETMRPRYG